MRPTLPTSTIVPKGTTGDLATGPEVTECDPIYRLFSEAIEASDWKQEALASYMDLDRTYLSKMCDGEKPIGVKHLRALPVEVERAFAARYARSLGLHVVEPLRGTVAQQAFIAGFLGMFAPSLLPARAGQMAHAEIDRRTNERRSA